MLKQLNYEKIPGEDVQPPSGGCVLKPPCLIFQTAFNTQPPSGGCVLKRWSHCLPTGRGRPAAFRRLCVETADTAKVGDVTWPAAFRRLCVETYYCEVYTDDWLPAAFRRLCVETDSSGDLGDMPSPAAFRRLCVETVGFERL